MKENKSKRILNVELNDDVKKVSITGKNGDEKVVMRQELGEDDLEQATGGVGTYYNGRTPYTPTISGCQPVGGR